jgi:hypothetical protein
MASMPCSCAAARAAELIGIDRQAAMKAGALAVLTAHDLPFIRVAVHPPLDPSVHKALPKFHGDRPRALCGWALALVLATDR